MTKEILERVDALEARINDAWRVLSIDARQAEISALEAEMSAPDFWNDQERAKRESQKLSELKKEVEAWVSLKKDVEDFLELVKIVEGEKDEAEAGRQLEALLKRYLDLEFSMLFSGKYDASNAVISIHAGAGGTDAQDWAEMLLRMFIRYAEKKGWKTRLVDESRGGEAGIKSATFFVEGRYAYGHLKGEAGVHRLVRQSPFNADALRQTSFALVEVVPEIDDTVEIEIKPEDLRIDTFMSGGKGGQSVNTTYSAVRIVHIPTKITVSCQNERSQTQNKETAMKILKGKLVALKEEELRKEKEKLRGEFHSAEWGNQIRSYVLHPYKMVKDHRTEVETSDTEAVLDGDLDAFIEGYLRMEAEKTDVKAELNRD
ncbi:peptide chain release factor 2 [Patescibacteria group bacterium]|nr:peptide chain release factor 2 [Patescibacteria group bacterium]MBU1034527.1 peptide chain release factor 2 [Patescibacteria group bacterium]MBU1629735.1 peptide chain release factor 2 [Patescibacteria group bacterium]MBU1907531.1 peptide chain release factor 2 [Patescibacteria group bacterium]